ncbi:hypothetical protein F862_gp055 [Vibrio phage vB_VpaS_MAR10]|uniref:Uncharacterized protein n=1 Tax=Vibrio phage vB_VpaS_MAR10 TaxID=1229755 RepID=K7RFK8_9CAUD|nr:hypothetical protein F862_gp055 [Vibrio phage vB_VpaS_MAR10]AFV81287.1 hypothetical protein MAR10_054 [Vibrio phage vB_VpaS_MAR10]
MKTVESNDPWVLLKVATENVGTAASCILDYHTLQDTVSD